jgi:tetratricopeptide (TPR) repeat protein
MTSQSSFQQIGQTVGAKLRAARLARKLTQSQLARPEFSVSYVSAIERGQIHPSLRALEIFAHRLGLSSSDLLSTQTSIDIKGLSVIGAGSQTKEVLELQFLEAQLLVHQGVMEQAITELNNINPKFLSPQQKMQRAYLLGWAYFKQSRFQESESVLAEALMLVNDPNDYFCLQILNVLGMVHASMHNHTQGLEYQLACLDWLEKEQYPFDQFAVAQAYTNMGLHYIHLERVDEAKKMFEVALAMTEVLTELDQLSSMYLHTSRYFAETEHYSDAMLYGYKSLQIYAQEYSNSLRSEIYHYLGRVMLQGDQQNALTYLEKLFHDSSVKQDKLALASVTSTIADLQLKQGKVIKAYKHAQRAYDLATPFGDHIIPAYASIVLGQITYARKDFKAGDIHFVAGLDMLERLEAREEFVNQSVAYAQLLEDRGMPKEALTYYKRAFEIRQKWE